MKEENTNEEIQSRREFFKNAAKKALPIVGAIALASTPLISKAAEETPMGCYQGCLTSCDGICQGSCRDSCVGSCKDSCTYGCQGSCLKSCQGSCTYSCEGSCLKSCEGFCKNGCSKSNWN